MLLFLVILPLMFIKNNGPISAETNYSPHADYLMNTNSCASCHSTHTALGQYFLLNQSDQTTLCLTCHNGIGSVYSVVYSWDQDYFHPVENLKNPKYNSPALQCSDCHSPHESNEATLIVRNQVYQGPLTGASGVEVKDWTKVLPGLQPTVDDYVYGFSAKLEADICLKCHSNYNANYSQLISGTSPPYTNQAVEFNPGNSSVHPIYGSGNNSYTNSTTMNEPFNQSTNEHTLLKCTDCHGAATAATTFLDSESNQNLHGSSYTFLLKKPANSNGLCLLCHKKSVYQDDGVGANGSRFNTTVYQAAYSSNSDNVYDAVYTSEYTGNLHPKHSTSLTCMECHGGSSIIGLTHGTNAMYGDPGFVTNSPTADQKIKHFLVGPGIKGWQDNGSTATCYTSGCHGKP